MESRPAEVVDVVDLDFGLYQSAGDVGVAAIGSADQPGAVEGVLGVDVGAVLKGEVEQFEGTFAGRDEIGALLAVVLGVDVGATTDQGARAPYVVVRRGCDQRLEVLLF